MSCNQVRIAPQALPYPNASNGNFTYGAWSNSVNRGTEVYVDSGTHRVYRKLDNSGMYNTGMGCQSGIPGLDNHCICPGSSNSMPYEMQSPAMTAAATNLLFAPFLPNAVPPLTPAAQLLVAERSPLYNGASYNMDAPF
jgi:hypothetical protein